MATINSFEDLKIWQRSRILSKDVYRLTMKGSFSRDFALKNQINEATGSVMDNIAEGFDRGGTREFITFLSYAKASAAEVRSQLYRALDRDHIDESAFKELNDEGLQIGKMITSFIMYLKATPLKGSKFHEPVEFYGKGVDERTLSDE